MRRRINRTVGAAILLAVSLNGVSTGLAQADRAKSPNAPTPPAAITLSQVQLGNVFTTAEAVQIPVQTAAAAVQWRVINYWRAEVRSGTTPVVEGKAVIEPGIPDKGYFEIALVARNGEQIVGEATTSFAIIAPVDIRQMPDSPFGVMTHFAQDWDTDIMPLIAKAGIRYIRDEHYWAQVEKKKGEYVFPPKSDAYMARAKELGIDPIVVMSFENKLYDDGNTPHTPEGCEAFAAYGEAILRQYGDQIKWLEVWNEYNGTWCKGPAAKDRPKSYTRIAKHVYERIKKVRPDVQILGGAAVLLPPPYFEGIFKNGGLNYMDAVVIHPYRGRPEGLDVEVEELQALMRQYNGGKEKPIWVTETGRTDKEPGGRERIAQYLVKQYTLLLSENAQPICWYLMRDYSTFKTMGLLRDIDDPWGRYAAAPPYPAYANLIQQLYGATFVKREPTDPRTYVEHFRKGDQEIRVCWANVPQQITFKTGSDVTVIDMMGVETVLRPVGGEVYLTLNDTPVYVRSGPVTLAEHGAFEMAATQTLDLLAPIELHYDGAMSGSMNLNGKAYGMKQGVVALAEPPAREVGARQYHHTVAFAGGPVAGAGTVQLQIVDPLKVTAEPALRSNSLQFTLANTSKSVAYSIEAIAWEVGGKKDKTVTLQRLAAGQQATIALPTGKLPAYTDQPAKITVSLKDRAPIEIEAIVSSNPIPMENAESAQPSIGLMDAGGRTAGSVRAAWNPTHLVLTVQGASARKILIGLAPTTLDWNDIRRGWYEFAVEKGKAVATVRPNEGGGEIAVAQAGDDTTITLPWEQLKGISPSDRTIRLSVATAGKSTATWGGGLIAGRTPAAYRLCRLDDRQAEQPGQAGQANLGSEHDLLVIEDRPAAPAVPAGKVIADSDEDYTNIQSRGGWSYGYFDGAGDEAYGVGDFKPMNFVQTIWGYEWAADGIKNLQLTRNGGHPNASAGRQIWAVRRWTSPVEGIVRLTGTVSHGNPKGDGVGLKVLVDGVVFDSLRAGGKSEKSARYDLIVKVKAGTIIDFALTPGPGADTSYDAANLSHKIERIK